MTAKYRLMVSYNFGASYQVDRTADDPADLMERGRELDEQWLRWTIETTDGEIVEWCGIHKGIAAAFGEQAAESEEA